MRFLEVSQISEKQFYRLTGVNRSVFGQMVEVVSANLKDFGRPRKLSVEDMVLMTLDYWREYRTQFHVGCSFGVSEATVSRTVRAVEVALLQDTRFHLPGKKALQEGALNLEVVVVDASEQRIERPQKNKSDSTPARKSATPKKDNS